MARTTSTKSSFVYQHHDELELVYAQPPQAKMPMIPDLRFEYSYLRSIQRYITVHRAPAPKINVHLDNDADKEEFEGVRVGSSGQSEQDSQPLALRNHPSEVIAIQWGRVLWVTARDQIISPLLQGALW